MPAVKPAPIKVGPETKEQIRLGAAMLGRNQSEFVSDAVCEYVQRHADELRSGITAARNALALGEDAALAYMTGASVEDVRRLSGR